MEHYSSKFYVVTEHHADTITLLDASIGECACQSIAIAIKFFVRQFQLLMSRDDSNAIAIFGSNALKVLPDCLVHQWRLHQVSDKRKLLVQRDTLLRLVRQRMLESKATSDRSIGMSRREPFSIGS